MFNRIGCSWVLPEAEFHCCAALLAMRWMQYQRFMRQDARPHGADFLRFCLLVVDVCSNGCEQEVCRLLCAQVLPTEELPKCRVQTQAPSSC